MEIAEKNLAKLKKLFAAMDEDSLTREEFVKHFETVVKLVENLKKTNEKEFELIHENFKLMSEKIKDDANSGVSSNKKEMMDYCYAEMEKMYKEHEKMMATMDKKMDKIPTVEEIKSQIKIPTVEEIEKDLPKLGKEMRDSLELLQGDERLDISAIKGLEKIENEIKRIDNKSTGGGFRASHSTKFYSLTADGSTKIFSVPKSATSIVLTSDTPFILFENNGFTINKTRTQITLTTDIAPSNGAQLLYQYSTLFNE